MSTARTNRTPGFTLLEVMLAVAILGLVAVSIYRFVQTTLFAVRVSTEQVRDTVLMESFTSYMRSQMQSFPPEQSGAISGDPHQFDEVSQDELRWISGPGCGLLTRNATGDWTVTLTTKKEELGVWRQDIEARNNRTWLPLISGIRGIEVRYFDARSQEWVDKWADSAAHPALVRVKLWKSRRGDDPYEVVLPLPPVTPGAKLPTFSNQQQQTPPGGVPVVVPGQNGTPAGGRINNPATGGTP